MKTRVILFHTPRVGIRGHERRLLLVLAQQIAPGVE